MQLHSIYRRCAQRFADRWAALTADLQPSRDAAAVPLPEAPLVTAMIAPACRDLAERIQISAGVRAAAQGDVDAFGYEPLAILPQEPWRALTVAETSRLLTRAALNDPGRTVAILRMPEGFAKRCRDSRRAQTGPTLDSIVADLEAVCHLGPPVHDLGAGSNPAGLPSVTTDPRSGRLIGLHLDSWDGLDLADRGRSSNRICVNIGEEDRFFLFVPVALMDMTSLIAGRLSDDETPPEIPLHRLFLKLFPDIPVMRLRVAPNEAYIAPTECLVHDGSSLGQRGLDEQLTVRGYIRPHAHVMSAVGTA